MSMTVKVQYEDGKPCQGTRVQVWVNNQGNDTDITNSNGEASFSYGPGTGTIYCDGKRVESENRSLSGYESITNRSGSYY